MKSAPCSGISSLTAPGGPQSMRAALPAFYRYASPRIVTALLAVGIGVRVGLGNWSLWDPVVALVVLLLWPVQEWLIHVFILHYEPVTLFGRRFDFEVPRSHRVHHRDPWRIDILFIPTSVFLYMPPLILAFYLVVTPSTALAFTGVVIYMVLTLHYEWVHFLIHSRYTPTTAYYRRLWRNHRLHHFKNEHHWFGVTMLGGDRLLRTSRDSAEVETSPTCRSIAGATAFE